MKTLLVTGGCGFIGSHFVRLALYSGGYRVVNLDRLTYAGDERRVGDAAGHQEYRFIHGDICDPEVVERTFREERPWAVVNFAAESHVDRSILDPARFLQTNLLGCQTLLQAARGSDVNRFLHISTDEVYGDADGYAPFGEEARMAPSSPYAASKAAADLLSLASHRTYGIPILIIRSSNNYGPYQFPEKLIPLTIRNAVNGEDLPVYGDGLQRRDWLHVEDNCRAILAVLERGAPGRVYNAGSGVQKTNLELIHEICRLLAAEGGVPLSDLLERIRLVKDRPGHDRSYSLNTARIRAELAWSPWVSLEEGLATTVRWYLGRRDWLQKTDSDEFRAYYDAVYHREWEPGK
jgi:dTDP-glucose 4,6-dehydratase